MKRITKAMIENSIYQHTLLQGAYFWRPSRIASERRSNEKRWQQLLPSYIGRYRKHDIEVRTYYHETCKNVYYKMIVVVDGKRGTVRTLKKLIGLVPNKAKGVEENV